MTTRKTEEQILIAKLLRQKEASDKFINNSHHIHIDNIGKPLYEYKESNYITTLNKVIV